MTKSALEPPRAGEPRPRGETPLDTGHELTQRAHLWEQAGRDASLLAEAEDLARLQGSSDVCNASELAYLAESARARGGGRGLLLSRAAALLIDAVIVLVAGLLLQFALGSVWAGLLVAYFAYFAACEWLGRRSFGMYMSGLAFEFEGAQQGRLGRALRLLMYWIPYGHGRFGRTVTIDTAAARKRPVAATLILGLQGFQAARTVAAFSALALFAGEDVGADECSTFRCFGLGLAQAALGMSNALPQGALLGNAQASIPVFGFPWLIVLGLAQLLWILGLCWLVSRSRWRWFRIAEGLTMLVVSLQGGGGNVEALSLLLSFHRGVRRDEAQHSESMQIYRQYARRRAEPRAMPEDP